MGFLGRSFCIYTAILFIFSLTGSKFIPNLDLSCLLLPWHQVYEAQLRVLCMECSRYLMECSDSCRVETYRPQNSEIPDGLQPRTHQNLKNNRGIEKLVYTDFSMAQSSLESFVTIISQMQLQNQGLPWLCAYTRLYVKTHSCARQGSYQYRNLFMFIRERSVAFLFRFSLGHSFLHLRGWYISVYAIKICLQ